jgi:hypothetical protein
MRCRLVLAIAVAVAGMIGLAGPAGAAAPPPGAVMSDSLRYEGRAPDAAGITEGKFDRVGGHDVLLTNGTYGFKSYDVSDPAHPKLLSTFMPADILGANGYWQGEDMDIDVRR